MKRLLSLFAVCVLSFGMCFSVVGCGADVQEAEEPADVTEDAESMEAPPLDDEAKEGTGVEGEG